VVDLTTQFSTELTKIEASITALQTRKQAQLSLKRRITRALLLYGSLAWFMLLALMYIYEFPNRTHFVAKCLKIGPLILWPMLSERMQRWSEERIGELQR
jgi:hypothetical protein